MSDRRTGREYWTTKALWAAFLGVALFYGAMALASTGTRIRDLGLSWPKIDDPLELGVTFLAVINLLQFVHLSRKKVMSRRLGARQTERLTVLEVVVPWLIRWAVLSAVPLWGLVLVSFSRDAGKLSPFIVVGILGFIVSFPSRRRVQELSPKVAP